MGVIANILYVLFFTSFFITCAASVEYWTFWTLVTSVWFFALLVNLLFNEYWWEEINEVGMPMKTFEAKKSD